MSANTSEALLPCPFCGNPNIDDDEGCFRTPIRDDIAFDGHTEYWTVRCGDPSCNAEQEGWTREEATQRWNRRAQSAELASLRARLKITDRCWRLAIKHAFDHGPNHLYPAWIVGHAEELIDAALTAERAKEGETRK